MKEVQVPRRLIAWARAHVVAATLTLCALTVASAAAGVFLTPQLYRATIGVEVKPNLGGLAINSSTDASAQSIEWVQPAMLKIVRHGLTGAALGDPSALYRMRCYRDSGDVDVVCTTTSSSRLAAAAILNQMVEIVIPVESAALEQGDELVIREHEEQYQALAQRDEELNAAIAALSRRPMTAKVRAVLRDDRSSVRVNRSIRNDIVVRIASIRLQIRNTAGSFQLLGRGASVASVPQLPWPLLGGAAGAILALCVLGTLALSSRPESERAHRTKTSLARA